MNYFLRITIKVWSNNPYQNNSEYVFIVKNYYNLFLDLSKSCKNGQKLCVIAQRFDWEFLLRIETLLFFAFSSLTSFPPFRSDHICGNLARWCLHFSVSIEDPNAVKDQKNEKLKKLNENFIEEVKKMYNLTKLQERPEADRYMDEIKRVATEIYNNSSKGDTAEQQLTFLLDLFVVKLKHYEMVIGDLDVSKNWTMRMTDESLLAFC
jgi:hypothetical protein